MSPLHTLTLKYYKRPEINQGQNVTQNYTVHVVVIGYH